MSGTIATIPKFQFSSATGAPLANGTLTVYVAGSTTPTNTWQDSALTIANTNPVTLDSRGECVLWLSSTVNYKFILKNAAGVTQWTQDNVSGADAHLRGDLAASSGASLAGYLPSGSGAVATTVQAELLHWSYATDFPNASAAAVSGVHGLVFAPGAYTISDNTTFPMPVRVMPGAVITVAAGKVATFSVGIDAGWYTIFSTSDDFIGSPISTTSVVIRNCNVKADWFCAKVADVQNILTIADQTNNLTKAYRAAVGNYTVANGSNWNTQYADGVLELGHGYYRIDGTFAWGTQVSTVYYKVTGFKMIGAGVNASYLIRTNMTSTAYVLFGAFYTGEMTVCDGFKITCYNPVGPVYASAAKALAFFQGDSLFIGEIWVSSAQTYTTDTNGLKRNGVGVQFSSCTDTFFNNIIAEYCVTPVAFHSAIVSGSNIDCYRALGQSIGLGCFVADYPDTQTTSSRVNITNIQAIGGDGFGIAVLENGDLGSLHINNGEFDGYNSELETYGGSYFCYLLTGTSLIGSITNLAIRNYQVSTFKLDGTASLGRAAGEFAIRDCYVSGQTASAGAYAFINCASTSYLNLLTDGVSLDGFAGCLLIAPTTGNARILNTSLSAYVGQADGGAGRQLFVSSGCSIQIVGITRNTSDTTALTQFGYAASGNVFIDVDNLYSATRAVAGSATVKMPSKVAFA